ncbi:MAG: hypothetical protein LBT50_00455 [Prevotellaceae bacterium]|jgi:hypothetical protein|nr:hypothetical protein [Prevotellaceae bacterium]
MINNNLVVYKNLTVYLIEGKDRLTERYMTLEEAIARGLAVLHETGNVGELVIDNLSEWYVFVMAGDIVKGGRQDRTMATDVILKPLSRDVPLKSFCVEHSRWHQRGGEDATYFSESKKMLSDEKLKIASRYRKSQGEVWEEVERYQRDASMALGNEVKSKESASSLQLTLDNENLQNSVKEYIDAIRPAFEKKSDITGFAFSINGRISTAENFGSAELFGKLRDKLLESAASEAFSKYDGKLDYRIPSAEDVKNFIIEAKDGQENISKTGEITLEKRYETPKSILFKTYHEDKGRKEKIHTSAYNTDGLGFNDNIRNYHN